MGPGRVRRIDWLILLGWSLCIALVRAGTVEDVDPYWQVRAGLENLDGLPLARPDTWSWAPVGGLWYPNSPGWNLFLAVAWRGGGFWGLFLLTVASILLYLLVVIAVSRALGARPLTILAGMLPLCLAAFAMLSPRGTLAAQTLLLAAIGCGYWWSRRPSTTGATANAGVALAGGLAFSLAGNWLHLSWAAYSVLVALAWAVMWLLTPGLGRGRLVGLVLGGTLGLASGVVLGPYGLQSFARSRVVLEVCRDLILEWTSPFDSALILRWGPACVLALGVTAGAVAWCARVLRSRSGDPRLPLAAALTIVAVPLALAGTIAVRFVGVALLFLVPLCAFGLTVLLGRWRRSASRQPPVGVWRHARMREWVDEGPWRVVLGVLLVVLVPGVLLLAWPHSVPRSARAIEALPQGCRLFTPTDESKAALLLRPDVTVWLDGRYDYYGRDRLLAQYRYLLQPSGNQPVPLGTTCVLVNERSREFDVGPFVQAIADNGGWTRSLDVDGYSVWVPSTPAETG